MSDESKVSVKSILKAASAKDMGHFSVGGMQYPSMSTSGKKTYSQEVKAHSSEEASPKEIRALIKTIDSLKKEIEKVRKEGLAFAQQARGQGVAEGKTKGYEQGRKEASAEYHSQLNTLKQNLANVFGVLSQEKNFFFAEAEQGAVRIASTIALKFVEHLSQEAKDVIEYSVKKGIRALGNETNLIVKVHPDDFDVVEDDVEFWKPIQSSLKDIKVIEDDRITRGGCLLETESGTVDVSVNMVVEGIEETLKMSLQHFGHLDDGLSDEARALHEKNIQRIKQQENERVEDEESHVAIEERVEKIDNAMIQAYEQLDVGGEDEDNSAGQKSSPVERHHLRDEGTDQAADELNTEENSSEDAVESSDNNDPISSESDNRNDGFDDDDREVNQLEENDGLDGGSMNEHEGGATDDDGDDDLPDFRNSIDPDRNPGGL